MNNTKEERVVYDESCTRCDTLVGKTASGLCYRCTMKEKQSLHEPLNLSKLYQSLSE